MKLSLRAKLAVAASLILLAPAVLAQAPQALSIIVNGVALEGKALNYKGRLYVPLEDIATATGGSYRVDATTGVVSATVLTPPGPGRPGELQRPYIKVVYEKKYTEQNNARVMATIVNQGERTAENVEMICIFKGNQREITSYVQNVGHLHPGERRTLEFRLFEGPPPGVYAPNVALGAVPDDKVYINGEWTRLSYEFKFNYQ